MDPRRRQSLELVADMRLIVEANGVTDEFLLACIDAIQDALDRDDETAAFNANRQLLVRCDELLTGRMYETEG